MYKLMQFLWIHIVTQEPCSIFQAVSYLFLVKPLAIKKEMNKLKEINLLEVYLRSMSVILNQQAGTLC